MTKDIQTLAETEPTDIDRLHSLVNVLNGATAELSKILNSMAYNGDIRSRKTRALAIRFESLCQARRALFVTQQVIKDSMR